MVGCDLKIQQTALFIRCIFSEDVVLCSVYSVTWFIRVPCNCTLSNSVQNEKIVDSCGRKVDVSSKPGQEVWRLPRLAKTASALGNRTGVGSVLTRKSNHWTLLEQARAFEKVWYITFFSNCDRPHRIVNKTRRNIHFDLFCWEC